MTSKFLFVPLISVIFYFGCTTNGKAKKSDDLRGHGSQSTDSLIESGISLKDSVFYLKRNSDSIRVKILVPEKIRGFLLFLHGWNLPSDEICVKTEYCSAFLDSGYVLVFPDFGKTTYQWQNYPQTKKTYLKYPTRSWMTDTFLVHLKEEFGIFSPGQRNFIVGVSTGGRGAALLALENPGIFKAAACLSADFDHAALANEPINNGYYGSIRSFPERWTGKDNIHNRAAEFKSGLYLAHGEKDKICPVSQTINFDAELKRVKSSIKIKTVIDPLGDHTYSWWGKQILSVNEFFSQF